MAKWYVSAKKADFAAIGAKFGIDQVTARIIRNRGVIGDDAVNEFINGKISDIADPALLKDGQRLVDILAQKIADKAKIRIIGDYDIDGVMSTYILVKALKRAGACVDYMIPDRVKDGYGLNVHLIDKAYKDGIDTVVTCDNGIAAIEEIAHAKGIFYGQNVISKNMILADRTQLMNGNSFILGVSGSGKSFAAKCEITSHMLATDADILIIDPEREYAPLVRALGGEVIEISATSQNHINAMDMTKEYGEINPIIEKSQFLQSLCEQIITGHTFTKGQQSIIDRCTESVYRYYLQGNYQGVPPTLQDFREELLKQPEPEAHTLALELELFTKGSLNTFAQQTNVDTDKRLICYDIMELGEQLRPIGMLVILDSILNRITANRRKGRQTFVYVDEIYLLFQYEYSAQFLFKLWKRVRKYGAFCTGITQDVEDLLQSHIARTMLSNSEFVLMLNQAATNREELARLLNISDTQLSYITNVDAGHGLIKIGNSLVPFENHFPRDTRLYQLMTTKPADRE